MADVKQIKEAVSQLSQSDLAKFRAWYEAFDQDLWDAQFESDVKAGNLDKLADQAIADFRAGKCKEL